jgi:hypothetical protein
MNVLTKVPRHAKASDSCRAARALLLLVGPALAGVCGCVRSPTSVSGRVTLNNEPVSGIVTFIGTGGEEASAPIAPDGEYVLPNPPLGPCKVTVKRFPGAPTGERPKGGPAVTIEMPRAGPPPPARYASVDNGLQFEVKQGKQKFDIPLKP